MVKILDCTTRDGGHIKNWDFSDKFVLNLIDCLEKSGNSQKVIDVKCLLTSEYIDDNKKVPKELNQLFDNENYRTELTKSYRYKPPFITLCGYFGCRKHQTPFFEDQI